MPAPLAQASRVGGRDRQVHMKEKILPRAGLFFAAAIAFLIALQIQPPHTDAAEEDVPERRYPVTIDDWSQFDSLAEKVEAIQVPEAKLLSMTTDELLDALIVYPLWWWDIMPSLQSAYDQMYTECNVLREFVSRSDAAEKLTEELDKIEELYDSGEINKSEYVWGQKYFETILSNLEKTEMR